MCIDYFFEVAALMYGGLTWNKKNRIPPCKGAEDISDLSLLANEKWAQ
jgi:hypothetical protein